MHCELVYDVCAYVHLSLYLSYVPFLCNVARSIECQCVSHTRIYRYCVFYCFLVVAAAGVDITIVCFTSLPLCVLYFVIVIVYFVSSSHSLVVSAQLLVRLKCIHRFLLILCGLDFSSLTY